jgi:hypothetical protein
LPPTDPEFTTNGWFWSGEVSAMLARRFGSWAIAAGPVATFYTQTFDAFHDGMFMPVHRSDTELMAFGAIRHEL